MEYLNLEDRAAVSAVASLGGKRDRNDADVAGGIKKSRVEPEEPADVPMPAPAQPEAAPVQEVIKPYPFFNYTDYSTESDPDPLTFLTPPGRVPNFCAKMHSILSRPEFKDIIAWMPHGRSWRVLKPREFEVRVIPTYFEHAKFSSFIRQANGWGFRRITQGADRNSYYHEKFLRGLPHLCKDMKRPGVSEKQAADPSHEPDLYKISELHPLPEKTTQDESILLDCTIKGGPKARMPIYSGALSSSSSSSVSSSSSMDTKVCATDYTTMQRPAAATQLTPRDQLNLDAFQKSLGASESQLKNLNVTGFSPTASVKPAVEAIPQPLMFSSAPQAQMGLAAVNNLTAGANKTSALSAANQLAFSNSNMAAAQFAAGFAAAAALNQQRFQQMLSSMGLPPPQQPPNGK